MSASTKPRPSGAHRRVSGAGAASPPPEANEPAQRAPLRGVPSGLILAPSVPLHGRLGNEARSPSPSSIPTRQDDSAHAEVMTTPPGRELPSEPGVEQRDEDVLVAELLTELRAGHSEALDQILPLVYKELRRTAHRELAVR